MVTWIRRLALLATTLVVVASMNVAVGTAATGGPLTGTWSGYIVADSHNAVKPIHIQIVVNAKETGGSWRISAACRGLLTLDSVSNGYHHFLRKLARGSTCAGGDIDCLKRAGANVDDLVTSHLGGEYDSAGTLSRVGN